MGLFVFFMEPANYTLDLIRAVYEPRGYGYAFIRGESTASPKGEWRTSAPVLEAMGWLRRLRFLVGVLRVADCVVVHSYSRPSAVALLVLNLFFRKNLAIDSDSLPSRPRQGWIRWAKSLYLGFFFRQFFVYGLAAGTREHREFYRQYGMAEDRILLMPLVVDAARYRMPQEQTPRTKVARRFGYIGRLVPHKSVEMALEAFAQMRRVFQDATFEVVGEGPERTALEMRFGGAPGVIFRGAVFGKTKVNLLRGLDCLVLPSAYEPWGLVVNEAEAVGIPCVVSDRVGCRADLIEGSPPAGLSVPWGDVEAMAKAMLCLASDAPLYAALAREAAIRSQSWDYGLYRRSLDAMLRVMQARSTEDGGQTR